MKQVSDVYLEQIINAYYADNAKKLHTVINQIFITHYGGITGKDMEEFYGIGSDVVMDILWNKDMIRLKEILTDIYTDPYYLLLKMNIKSDIVINVYLKLNLLTRKAIK